MHKPTVTFVVHKGKLEIQALLLAASLRFFNQNNFNLIACIPENISHDKNFITKQTEIYLNSLNVVIKTTQNPIGNDYLIGNKLQCLSVADSAQRVFLDTDILCTKKLNLPILKNNEIGVKPADRKTYQWTTDQWRSAYQKYADHTLKSKDIIFSSVFKEPMLPYFNAGVIIINGCHDFAYTWSQIAKAIDKDKSLSNKRPWLDQLALPLAIKKSGLETILLTEKHNFPANIKAVNTDLKMEITHYHRPSILANSQFAIETIIKIMDKFPWLLDVFKKDKDWHCVADRIAQHMSSTPAKQTIKHTLITQLSTSNENKLIGNLKKDLTKQVIPQPSKILKPLSRRYYPWGMTAYFSKIEYENTLSSQEAHEVFYTLNNSLIFGISRIKSILPNCTIVIKISNPLETIKNWGDDFLSEGSHEHILLNQQKQWLDSQQLGFLNNLLENPDPVTRNALYWCMLAQILIDSKSLITLEAEGFSNEEYFNKLNNNPSGKNDEIIWSIISDHYSSLLRNVQN